MPNSFLILLFSLTTNFYIISYATELIIVNNCKYPIWPGILATTGHQTLNNGGFSLKTNQQIVIQPPNNWSGRIWARQGCNYAQSGKFTCQTGDCNGQFHCNGTGGQPPATLAEMTLGTDKNPMHYYDISLVDGFNVPASMIPVGGGGVNGCGVAACEADLNVCCPQNLVVRREGKVVGCMSACVATGDDKYCCSGEYASVENCKTTAFGHLFKAICPRAYSYAYDEESGLKVCRAKRYVITFCPPN